MFYLKVFFIEVEIFPKKFKNGEFIIFLNFCLLLTYENVFLLNKSQA
jgi:hypothetical protein